MKSLIPSNLTGKDLFTYLVKNEDRIHHAKKSVIKHSDGCYASPLLVDDKGNLVSKAENAVMETDGRLKVVPVINTTNWLDSHGDVHIPGIWKKSISDNKKMGFYLLKSHRRDFEDIIAEECAAMTKSLSWRELGVDMSGTTEALVFTAFLEKERNEYMYEQYAKKRVKKHSVGMQYVKLLTCIDDDDYPVQKENWDKYIGMVANREEAEADGYFWAILEAKITEGSAVVFASNPVTPTLETTMESKDSAEDTTNQPLSGTEKEPLTFDLGRAIQDTKFF